MSAHYEIKDTSVLQCGPYGDTRRKQGRTKVGKTKQNKQTRKRPRGETSQLPLPLPQEGRLHSFKITAFKVTQLLLVTTYGLTERKEPKPRATEMTPG